MTPALGEADMIREPRDTARPISTQVFGNMRL